MNKKDYRYFNLARLISLESTYPRVKIGAIIVDKKNILSVGVNSTKSHPIQKIYNKFRFDTNCCRSHSLHAEIHALISIPKDIDLSNATMYIYRENRKGDIAICRPCASCMNMIKDYGIKRICYTTNDGYCEEVLRR